MKRKIESGPSENVIQKAMRLAKQEQQPFKVVLKRLIDSGEGPKSTGSTLVELVEKYGPKHPVDLPDDPVGAYFEFLGEKK